MALVLAHLGEKLRTISNEAHMSIAALSAYLNEVLFSLPLEMSHGAFLLNISIVYMLYLGYAFCAFL